MSDLSGYVEKIRARSGDTVPLDNVAEIVGHLVTSIEGDIAVGDLTIHRELNELVEYIKEAKRDLATPAFPGISGSHFTQATDELGAVVAATEEATSIFLDSAEQIENMAESSSDEAIAASLRDIATRIYEGSNFQDITGQRINKVIGVVRHIETEITRIADLGDAALGGVPADADESDEAHLLNGPSMPDESSSQDDIDALFASLD